MKILFALFIALCAWSAQAVEYRFNGAKPQVIVDVRSPEEFAAGHIEGAINVPLEQVAQGVPAIKGVGKDSTILLYCRSGRRSGIATETLAKQGYSHVLNGGGMDSLKPQLKACSAKSC